MDSPAADDGPARDSVDRRRVPLSEPDLRPARSRRQLVGNRAVRSDAGRIVVALRRWTNADLRTTTGRALPRPHTGDCQGGPADSGRASSRARECQVVMIAVGAVQPQNKKRKINTNNKKH